MSLTSNAFFGSSFVPGRVGDNRPIVVWEDFVSTASTFSEAGTGDWLIKVGGASPTLPTQVNEAGGAVTMTTSADGTGSFVACQYVGEAFSLAQGRELYFESRFLLTTTADFYMGMSVKEDNLNWASVVDAVMFGMEANGGAFLTRMSKDSAGGNVATGVTLPNETYTTVAFRCRQDKTVEFYVDGVRAATIDTPTNFPDDEELSPGFQIQSNSTTAQTLKVDYVLVVGERP